MDFQAQGGNERDLHGEFVSQLWSTPRSQEAVVPLIFFSFFMCFMSHRIYLNINCQQPLRLVKTVPPKFVTKKEAIRCSLRNRLGVPDPGAAHDSSPWPLALQGAPPHRLTVAERMNRCGPSLAEVDCLFGTDVAAWLNNGVCRAAPPPPSPHHIPGD